MTRVTVLTSSCGIVGFSVVGHSGYGEKGGDIVCAAVSSAVQLTVNGICELAGAEADVETNDDEACLYFKLKGSPDEKTALMLSAFEMQIEMLSEEFSEFIELSYAEV